MKSIIIYGSQYGTSKLYAEKLSEMTGIEAVSCDDVKRPAEYEQIIYLGSLYAGGVKGLKKTAAALKGSDVRLIIVTVGLADVTIKENTDNIKKALVGQVDESLLEKAEIFHLRGMIDYSGLSFKHSMMMKMMFSYLKKKPAEELTGEDKAMMETYNQKISFVDYDSLKPIAEAIR